MISIHALRGEGDNTALAGNHRRGNFNPRPPWGGRLFHIFLSLSFSFQISIHALRGEGDQQALHGAGPAPDFNPRPPWGGRPHPRKVCSDRGQISIHALRGEGDRHHWMNLYNKCDFNPRPPWGGRPTGINIINVINCYFNPRPPWGGRLFRRTILCPRRYFNPRPPWGGRRRPQGFSDFDFAISIHALRGEGDDYVDNHLFGLQISIHALRGEGDLQACGAERQ